MMLDIPTLINLLCVVASIIFFIAKLDANTKSNHEFYKKAMDTLQENIESKFKYFESNMNEKFYGINEKFSSMKNDINRLERKQEESNKIKERLAIVEHTLKEVSSCLRVKVNVDAPYVARDDEE